ncbi:MAG: COG1361 S-layer family protein [Candidatus Woesearchaeota archaeon]
MKNKLLISLILVAICMFATTVYADNSGSSVITVSLVNQDPDPAVAGEIVEIRIGVENRGGVAADDMVIELDPKYPFSMIPGENPIQELGTLGAYMAGTSMKIVKYKLKADRDVAAGEYGLGLWTYSKGASTNGNQRSLNIEIKNKENAEIIYIDKTKLIPGKQTPIKFTINNVGSAPLRDLTFSWENEDVVILPVGSDDTKYIKYIDIGDSAELTYQVIADTNAEPGLYKLSLSLKYDDPSTGTEKEISTIAGIYVGGETDFDIAFSESTMGETAFTIANIGSNPATSVSVIIPDQEGWKVTGSKSAIIGNLNKGDYTVATFKLQAGMGAGERTAMTAEERAAIREAGEMPAFQAQDTVIVQIAYTDTMGERRTVEKEIAVNGATMMAAASTDGSAAASTGFPMRRQQQQSFLSKYWVHMAVIAVVALLIAGMVYIRRRKRNEPGFKLKDVFKGKKKLK